VSDNNVSEVVAGKTGFITDVNQYFTALRENFFPRNSSGVVADAAGSLGDSNRRWFKGYFSAKQPFEIGTIPNGGTPSGLMMPYTISQTVAPYGWIFADGKTIGDVGSGADHEGAEFEYLFDAYKLISNYGNAGTEVFANGDTVKIPDPMATGEFIRPLTSGRDMGDTQTDQNKAHNHSFTNDYHGTGAGISTEIFGTDGSFSESKVVTTTSNGGSESRPVNTAFPYIIKI
jgi:hypothetical protein